jgi:hypothetical protein
MKFSPTRGSPLYRAINVPWLTKPSPSRSVEARYSRHKPESEVVIESAPIAKAVRPRRALLLTPITDEVLLSHDRS